MRRRHSLANPAQFPQKFANSSSAKIDEFLQRIGNHINAYNNVPKAYKRRRSHTVSVRPGTTDLSSAQQVQQVSIENEEAHSIFGRKACPDLKK